MKLRVKEGQGPAFRLDGQPIHFGLYNIPADLSQEQAQAVVDAGAGEFVADEAPKKVSKGKTDDILS